MSHSAPHPRQRRPIVLAAAAAALGAIALLPGCATAPAPAPQVKAPVAPVQAAAPVQVAPSGPHSNAGTPREYRRDAAAHLYSLNRDRIYKGRMPPLLYAVGVLQVEVDQNGNVLATHWMRAPSHAPEVMAEIERTVRRAAPFPSPTRLGHVTYTDTWLWDKSGRFQLDTLTEGQN